MGWIEYTIATIYGFASVLLYFIADYVIVRHRKIFDSSFFQLFLYESALNLLLYSVNYFSMRVSLIASRGSVLAVFYEELDWDIFLSFVYGMRYHMAYVQYTIIMLIALNRLTVVKYDLEKYWRSYCWIAILGTFLIPLINTHIVFKYTCRFAYKEAEDDYSLTTTMPVKDIYEYLLPYMVLASVLAFILNTMSYFTVQSMTTLSKKRVNANFIKLIGITCLIEIIGTAISVCLYLKFALPQWSLSFLNEILPYVSESLTLLQPWLLMRDNMRHTLGFPKKSVAVFKSRSLTS
ncbi:unnamed protein product [Caenorhabditis sp. 36 PRJEB53466]|nr:unnamed protein product [Caenorhabditis sp. 36 PRJEB53466]